jgi:hypothetical protein
MKHFMADLAGVTKMAILKWSRDECPRMGAEFTKILADQSVASAL